MRLGLREANQRFSRAIKAVRDGREIVLTERGRPIAVIKPFRAGDPKERALRVMADEGLIKLPAQKGRMPPFRYPAPIKGPSLAQTIIDEREDRA